MSGELAYIDWLRQRVPGRDDVLVGLGDDAAVLRPSDRPLIVTTDMLLEGSCFRLAEAGARRVGRKALAVNLSDIAAMAGVPRSAVVSVGLPRSGGRRLAEELYEGMADIAAQFQVVLVGGDTNSWDGGLVISVSLLAEATTRGPVLRSGAKPGDSIFVTGPLGGSIRGKHLDFTPRVQEALRLHELVDLHAMIDISDGLARDLHHLCAASRCGALLRADAIPIAQAALDLAQDDQLPPLDHALYDGEDFELLFAVSPADGQRLLREQPCPLFCIGQFIDQGFWLERPGRREPLEPRGYEHRLL